MGPDDAGGWAIWLRNQPSGLVLRFGADEGDTAERLFQQLEFFELLTPETAAMPSQDRDHRLTSVGIEGSSRKERRATRTRKQHPSAVHPSRHLLSKRRPDRALGSWLNLAKVAMALLMIATFAYLVTLLPLGRGPELPAAGSLFGEGPGGRLPSVPDPLSSDPQLDGSVPSTLPGIEVHANPEGGYLFSYPESWRVDVHGGETLLADPDDSVRVVFGPGRDGSLARASASLIARVTRSHAGAEALTSSRELTPEGLRALIVGGTLPQDPAEGRFLAISVKGADANKVITVFFSAGSDVLQELDAIRAILSSYRVGTTS